MKILITGAGGFIGNHLVNKLKQEGHWVKGVDIKLPEFSVTRANEFELLDLRNAESCKKLMADKYSEVYQLAADMGGMGHIQSAECEIMKNNILINTNMIDAAFGKADKYFFSSSVCVYRNMKIGEPALDELEAYPAWPDNEYGWEKLYAERMAFAYGRRFGTPVRIARFQNTYGPLGTWQGGREKAPAALSRKIALADNEIDVWGTGTAVRSYTYIDDLLDGILLYMRSNLNEPVNIGSPEYVNVRELAELIIRISGKNLRIKYVEGPVGVESRNFSNSKIESLGWKSHWSLERGMEVTYNWIKSQVQ